MTSTLETIRIVETPYVAAELSIANDIDDFDYIIPKLEPVGAVLRETDRRAVVREIVTRLNELSDIPVKDGYRNEADFGLAAYIWILARISPGVARLISPQIRDIPNVWWAARAADAIEVWAKQEVSRESNATRSSWTNELFTRFSTRLNVPLIQEQHTADESIDTESSIAVGFDSNEAVYSASASATG